MKHSIGGVQFYIIYIDDCTRYTEVYFLVTKSVDEILAKFQAYQAWVKAPDGSMLLLRKALYGLKQVPRLWFEDINGYLQSLGFRQSAKDPNLYLQPGVLLMLYVDDLLIVDDGQKEKDTKSRGCCRQNRRCVTWERSRGF